MPVHTVRESLGPLFFGADQVGIGEASAKFCRELNENLGMVEGQEVEVQVEAVQSANQWGEGS
jgi:hypothetical protein